MVFCSDYEKRVFIASVEFPFHDSQEHLDASDALWDPFIEKKGRKFDVFTSYLLLQSRSLNTGVKKREKNILAVTHSVQCAPQNTGKPIILQLLSWRMLHNGTFLLKKCFWICKKQNCILIWMGSFPWDYCKTNFHRNKNEMLFFNHNKWSSAKGETIAQKLLISMGKERPSTLVPFG